MPTVFAALRRRIWIAHRFEIHFNPDLQSEIPEKPALNPDAAAEAPVKNRPPANRDG
jgi:hypothetical protein